MKRKYYGIALFLIIFFLLCVVMNLNMNLRTENAILNNKIQTNQQIIDSLEKQINTLTAQNNKLLATQLKEVEENVQEEVKIIQPQVDANKVKNFVWLSVIGEFLKNAVTGLKPVIVP